MNKRRNNELIKLANEKLKDSKMLKTDDSIAESYDGKTAALSVSVAMSDLLPTLAIYFQDYDPKHPDAPCRRKVLDVVATMITIPEKDIKFGNAEELLRYSIEHSKYIPYLRKELIDCSIALKQVVRTYNLV